eukprot:223110-Amphidinium_carterae.1
MGTSSVILWTTSARTVTSASVSREGRPVWGVVSRFHLRVTLSSTSPKSSSAWALASRRLFDQDQPKRAFCRSA